MLSAAWLLAGATLAMTVALGLILAFHWLRYAMNLSATSITLITYSTVSLFLVIGMFSALVATSSTL